MLDIHKPPPSSDTKTYFSHSLLPAYIDPHHTSTKKKPFTTFAAQPHTHTLDLVLPAELRDIVRTHLAAHTPRVYVRAFLKLGDVLDSDFLDAYVRNGSARMVSAGRLLVDTRFEIGDGVLAIEMPRAVYERAGLVGVPVEDGGRKHQRNRWRVQVDLTQACMRKGKKGFERLVWAAENVLGESTSWLFFSANPSFHESVREGREVLSRHAPEVFALAPQVETLQGVVASRLQVGENALSALYHQDDALALLEWLDMLRLGSPRVRDGSPVNSHLSRYAVPDLGRGVETRELVRVRWTGFVTPAFAQDVFLDVWNAAYKGKRDPKRRKGDAAQAEDHAHVAMDGTQDGTEAGAWFSMSAQAFGGKNAWSLMQFASRETLVWDVEA